MNGINYQSSFNNLSQADRSQQYIHRMPAVNQEQNADIQRQQTAQRNEMAVQPEAAEGKKTDPDDKRRENPRRKKRRVCAKTDKQEPRHHAGGGFIDVSV